LIEHRLRLEIHVPYRVTAVAERRYRHVMTLTFCSDRSPAEWIVRSELPWQQLVSFGPAGFDAYARLRLLPDPVRRGQSENDVEAEDWRTDQLRTLFDVLGGQTTTPGSCYFCVWEGFGAAESTMDEDAVYLDAESAASRPDARPGLAPALSSPQAPRVVLPHRAYWLFHGPLAQAGHWDAAQRWPGHHRLGDAEAAFVWPADHAWCVAHDVDPHWAGIGGSMPSVNRLIADPRLDVVPTDPTQEQPLYR